MGKKEEACKSEHFQLHRNPPAQVYTYCQAMTKKMDQETKSKEDDKAAGMHLKSAKRRLDTDDDRKGTIGAQSVQQQSAVKDECASVGEKQDGVKTTVGTPSAASAVVSPVLLPGQVPGEDDKPLTGPVRMGIDSVLNFQRVYLADESDDDDDGGGGKGRGGKKGKGKGRKKRGTGRQNRNAYAKSRVGRFREYRRKCAFVGD